MSPLGGMEQKSQVPGLPKFTWKVGSPVQCPDPCRGNPAADLDPVCVYWGEELRVPACPLCLREGVGCVPPSHPSFSTSVANLEPKPQALHTLHTLHLFFIPIPFPIHGPLQSQLLYPSSFVPLPFLPLILAFLSPGLECF